MGNKMKFLEFFNPLDIEHLRAYNHLQKTGAWPLGFIPEEVYQNMEPNWYMLIQSKMADLWVGTNIFMHDMKPDEKLKDKIIDLDRLLKIGKKTQKENNNARKSNEQSSQGDK
jgi:hypothetical protein